MNKVKTMKVGGGAEYAKVAERLKLFREECPYGLIDTSMEMNGTHVIFKTRVLKDKKDETSAEATGHAIMSIKESEKQKAFEKLETVSVGRALATLGYLASGEIASGEEMQRYYEAKFEKAIEELEEVKTLKELKAFWEKYQNSGKELMELIVEKKQQLTQNDEK